jgi:hypothetical protein
MNHLCAGHKKLLSGPHATRGPRVANPLFKATVVTNNKLITIATKIFSVVR